MCVPHTPSVIVFNGTDHSRVSFLYSLWALLLPSPECRHGHHCSHEQQTQPSLDHDPALSIKERPVMMLAQRGFEVRWRLSFARRFSGSFGLLESASDTSLFDLVCADYFPRAKLSLRRQNYWSHTQKRV